MFRTRGATLHNVTMPDLQPIAVKPESLTQIVYDAIKDAIVTKSLAPGTRVSEASLASQLQVSKTPVREAMQRLQAVGLIESTGAKTSRVVTPSSERIREAFEVRAAVEAGIARLAAAHATPAQRDGLLVAAERSLTCAEAGDIDGFRRWDGEFHALLAASSGNDRLNEMAANASTLTRVLRDRDAPTPGHATECAGYHVAIARAVGRGDGDGAAGAMAGHIDLVATTVLATHDGRGAAAVTP